MMSTLSSGLTHDTVTKIRRDLNLIMMGLLSGVVFWLVYEGVSSLRMIMGWI